MYSLNVHGSRDCLYTVSVFDKDLCAGNISHHKKTPKTNIAIYTRHIFNLLVIFLVNMSAERNSGVLKVSLFRLGEMILVNYV